MLKALQLNKFRSHSSSTFHFGPGINGIIGLSLSGKTNVLRALKWLLTNRPPGFKFHSDFSKKPTSVSVTLEDETIIQVNRSKKSSVEYTLLQKGKRKKHWDKVGRSVPDIVVDKLNISELNIQEQLDAPFLVTSAGGEIARTINRITKAEKLDKWIKSLNSRINALKYKQQTFVTALQSTKAELKRYKNLDELDLKISSLGKITTRIKKLDDEYTGIDELLANIEDTKSTIKINRRYLKAKVAIDQIEKIEDKLALLSTEESNILQAIETQGKLRTERLRRKTLVYRYINAIAKDKICPTCFHSITKKDIERITREVTTTKRHSGDE